MADGRINGLYTQYGHDAHLFNLLSRTSTGMFMYEQGFEEIPLDKRVARIFKDEMFKETLDQTVAFLPMRKILETMNPEEMYNLFVSIKPTHIKISSFYGNELNSPAQKFELLMLSMKLRLFQYKKYSKGIKSREGKVIKAQFGSTLTKAEEQFLAHQTVALLKASKAAVGVV
jgi:hypothetical protein